MSAREPEGGWGNHSGVPVDPLQGLFLSSSILSSPSLILEHLLSIPSEGLEA